MIIVWKQASNILDEFAEASSSTGVFESYVSNMFRIISRTPFCDQLSYVDKKTELSKLSVEMAMSGMRDKFAEKPIDNIRQSCKQLADLADTFIQGIDDSLLLQPASLDLATLKKRPGDHLVRIFMLFKENFKFLVHYFFVLVVGFLYCSFLPWYVASW